MTVRPAPRAEFASVSLRAVRLVALVCVGLSVASPSVLAQALQLSVEDPEQRFEVGEEIVFRFESEGERGELTYDIGYSERAGFFESGTLDYDGGVAEFRYRPTVPCFLYVKARLGGRSTDLGVVVGRDDIGALAPAPGDFDEFWDGQKAELAEVPLDVRRERIGETEYSTRYRFSAAGVDGRRVHGFIVLPKGGGGERKPAALMLPAYGSRGPSSPAHEMAERANAISVSITIHDAPAGTSAPEAYDNSDLRDPEEIYYRYGVLAAIRAIDVIADMPEWNGEDLLVYGESQGGGLTLLTAGIDERVTLVYQAYAALSQHNGATVGQASGFPFFLEKAADRYGEQGLAEAREAVKYHDAIYGAQRFDGPSAHFVNYRDPICPPATHYAATNEMSGPRVVLHSFDLDHSKPREFIADIRAFFRTHVPDARTPPFPYEDENLNYRVSAGEDGDGQAGRPIRLRGEAGYDGGSLGRDWEVSWRVLDGPGTMRLSRPNALVTNATFSERGTYRVRLQIQVPHPTDERKYYLLLDDVTVTVEEGVSSQDALESVRDVRVFPNPARGDLRVEAHFSAADEVSVALYDVVGRELLREAAVATGPGTQLRHTLPTASLPAGPYVLVLRGHAGIHRETVVVE